MSTYYYFHCNKHQLSGGLFTRQAWGYGSADLIDTFKFVMYHVKECGPENIGMHSEHEEENWIQTNCGGKRRQHLLDTRDIFPHSDDWEFMENIPHGEDYNPFWVETELARLEQ